MWTSPLFLKAGINACVRDVVTSKDLTKDLVSFCFSSTPVPFIPSKTRIQALQHFQNHPRRLLRLRLNTKTNFYKQLLFHLVVDPIAGDTSRNLPLIKVGRGSVRVPTFWKDVVPRPFHRVAQTVNTLTGRWSLRHFLVRNLRHAVNRLASSRAKRRCLRVPCNCRVRPLGDDRQPQHYDYLAQ